jgi:hypothetical protein
MDKSPASTVVCRSVALDIFLRAMVMDRGPQEPQSRFGRDGG